MTLTRDAIPAVVRALELGHDVKLVLEERIDAEVRRMYAAGELHGDDTPSTSTRRRGRELTVNPRRAVVVEEAA